MSQQNFKKFMGISVTHGYYPDGQIDGVRLVPSPSTAELLRQYRLLWKAQPDGRVQGLLFGQTGTNGFLIPLPADASLVFHLYMPNPAWMRFTDPVQTPGERPLRFVHQANAPTLVQETGNVSPEAQAIAIEAKRLGAAAAIVLRGSVGHPLEGRDFRLAFHARTVPWTYFVVLRGYAPADTFGIVDDAGTWLFDEIQAAMQTDPVGYAREISYRAALSDRWPNARIHVFRSRESHAWQAAPRPGLQLRKYGDAPDTLIPNLPSPATSDFLVVSATKEGIFEPIITEQSLFA
jgi:hypothetical protein